MVNDWVLVVEDDDDLRELVLVPGLKARGFERVHAAASAFEAYRSILAQAFSIFVLDVGLPDENGFEVAKRIRAATDAGVIMLTGWRKSTADQVKGLDVGADAYLTKPVDLDLLAATIRSVLRRKHLKAEAQPAARTAWHLSADGWIVSSPGGANVSLTRIERAFLQLLFAHVGRVVERDLIASTLHGEAGEAHGFDPHRIELLVHRLRKKILKETGDAFPLNTVRGAGYAVTAS